MSDIWADHYVRCSVCEGVFLLRVRHEDLRAHASGALAQAVFPYLTAAQRELLISRTCGECFEEAFAGWYVTTADREDRDGTDVSDVDG